MKTRGTYVSFLFCALLSLVIVLFLPSIAFAAATYTITDPGGGNCSAIGTWNAATKTCTLNRDLVIQSSTGLDGIEVASDGITLDGAGHTLSLQGTQTGQSGVLFNSRTGGMVKNIKVTGFLDGVSLLGSTNITVRGNRLTSNVFGMYNASNNTTIFGNTISLNTWYGIQVAAGLNNTSISKNNFISNNIQIVVGSVGVGDNYSNNYWNDFDSPAEGCLNRTPFDQVCDSAYNFPNGGDPAPYVLRNIWMRRDWTWYDNVGGTDWVLLANSSLGIDNFMYDLRIANTPQNPVALPGAGPGYITSGRTTYSVFPGIMNGPVNADILLDERLGPITSQRILWPKGGSSLEEVPGTPAIFMDHRLYWPWYDMQSPGYKNWVLISNPYDYQIHYNVLIGGMTMISDGVIPAGGRVTPTFPGVMGGPLEINAWNDGGDPVFIMASQRVLSNSGTAFNEVVGQPDHYLASDFIWTWYDMTGGARNWVLVANPTRTGDPVTYIVYYEVWIGGTKVRNGGPIAPGANETPTFPGTMGGPVEVKTFSDAAHTIPAKAIASQRSVWGPSFEEVSGYNVTLMGFTYSWTWYDQVSTGSKNWVLVATEPGETDTVTVELTFTDQATGTPVMVTHDITPAEKRWTPTFPGKMGGPVSVTAYKRGDPPTGKSVIASQRVLWNGYFNEVWGQ